jgi:hypothetical protein
MKKFYILFLFFISVVVSRAQPVLDWAHALIGTYNTGNAITLDSSGNSYSTGYFSGTTDFDPGSGTLFFTSQGSKDVYIHKLDANGNLVWAFTMGAAGDDTGWGITTDNEENLLVTGRLSGSADVDPGPGITTLGNDAFVCKYSNSGSLIWAREFGTTTSGHVIVTDDDGNVYVSGMYSFAADFDPGPGSYILPSAIPNYSTDMFICKLDRDGNFIWARNFSGPDVEWVWGIHLDNKRNVYTNGWFNDSVDFDPGQGISRLQGSGGNSFISVLDSNGNFAQAFDIGNGWSCCYDLLIDKEQNIFITGDFSGTTDFDLDTGIYSMTSAGINDIYVCKYDSDFTFKWAVRMGGTNREAGGHVLLDSSGNIFVVGAFISQPVDFDPGSSIYTMSATGNWGDCFIAKLDPKGNFICAGRIGGISEVCTNGAVMWKNSIIMTGALVGASDFDPGSGVYNLGYNGRAIFTCRLYDCGYIMSSGPVDESSVSVTIFPNPGKGTLSFLGVTLPSAITVFNAVGNRTGQFQLETNFIHLDLPSGIYFVLIENGEERITKKIIIE